ncbi:MAG: guanylate kinase [Candidatus Moraniibacteriota bacterium]|nr:MAG: guanylate kinase [Candidatus Moranbacteria bacterium]
MHNLIQNLFIISGPSGVGEDSVIEGLRERIPIERVITSTTRQPREGESQGVPYYFLSKEDFKKGIEKEIFIEYAKEYNDEYYGVTKEEIERVIQSGKIGIWKIEWKGVITAKKLFPSIQSILLTVSDLSILEKRIQKRGSVSKEYITERMLYTIEWLSHKDIYDYIVYNEEGKLTQTIQEVQTIIENNSLLYKKDSDNRA